jgi:hypothetical protein
MIDGGFSVRSHGLMLAVALAGSCLVQSPRIIEYVKILAGEFIMGCSPN